MGKAVGSSRLGDLYSKGKVRKRREWRGVADTLYDYSRWLYIMFELGKFILKPNNLKGMLRYRWMGNYLAVPMMLDRITEGFRGPQLRIAHTQFDLVIVSMAYDIGLLFKADRRIGDDKELSARSVLLDENEMTAIMMGFPTLNGISREIPTVYTAVLLNQHAAEHYIDVAQQYGLPGDVCPMPEAECGISIDDDFCVFGACAVQCNTTCDGSLLGNGIISQRLELEDGVPVFQLAAPLRHESEDIVEYSTQEVRNAIEFIKKHTGAEWDWKYYFECAKRVNRATRTRMELLEINKTEYPQTPGMLLSLYCETDYLGVCGKSEKFAKTDLKICKMAEDAYRRKTRVAKEYRHRAVVWGVQSQYFFEMLNWMTNCWGIIPLTDMLTMVNTDMIADEDTPENREKAIYDIAKLTRSMIMSGRTHGGYAVILDQMWEICQEYDADILILWEHMGCKSLVGMHGQFEEQARKHGIHLIWVTHDLCDARVMSRQGIRDQINRYMRTVFREEPLDPSLEFLEDELSW